MTTWSHAVSSTPPDAAAVDGRVAALRGARVSHARRRYVDVLVAVSMLCAAALIAVGVASALADRARTQRLVEHGIPVAVTVTQCRGVLAGSGSNGASYACFGTYQLGARTYTESIASMTTFAATGTVVEAVADPARHSSIVLASSLRSASPALRPLVVWAALGLAWIVLASWLVRGRLRARTALG